MMALLLPLVLVSVPLVLIVDRFADSSPSLCFVLIVIWLFYSLFAFYGGMFIGSKIDNWFLN